MTKLLSMIAAAASLALPGLAQAQIAPANDTLAIWQQTTAGQTIPANAVPGGLEQGKPTALCAANYQGAREIGRVVSGGCAFGHGGLEVRQASYEVLLGNSAALAQNPQFIRWVPGQNGQTPPGAFVAAREGEMLLPVCHAAVAGGVTPGKLTPAGCKVAAAGREAVVPQYEVLVISRIAAAVPTATLAAAANSQTSSTSARGSSISGIGGITPLDIQGMDLETAMMAVQSQRANLLETQLKTQLEDIQKRNQQIAELNNKIAQLRADRGTPKSPLSVAETDKQIEQLKSQIDSLNSSQQMDMLRMQSLTNKRNEAFDLMSNFIKKMADSRSSILGNMR